MEKVLEFIQKEICKDRELLYLCKFGSSLYGTNVPNSDTDYKGVFLPTKKEMLLGNKCKSLKYDTGNDDSKNTKEDLDIDLWSLQYFLELVGKGETNAIDLLFSPTNEECVVYKDNRMNSIFQNPLRLFSPIKTKSFIGYCIGQSRRYGIRGSKLGILKNIYRFLQKVDNFDDLKLRDVCNTILKLHKDNSYCFQKEINGESALVIAGKVHLFSISLSEFFIRIEREYKKYGKRAEEAERNKGIDWKALSHAIRAIHQMQELLKYGKITYPLESRDLLKKIKTGECDFREVESLIINGISEIEELQKISDVKGSKDQNFVNRIILNLYEENYG